MLFVRCYYYGQAFGEEKLNKTVIAKLWTNECFNNFPFWATFIKEEMQAKAPSFWQA